jgi:hypothetical protein
VLARAESGARAQPQHRLGHLARRADAAHRVAGVGARLRGGAGARVVVGAGVGWGGGDAEGRARRQCAASAPLAAMPRAAAARTHPPTHPTWYSGQRRAKRSTMGVSVVAGHTALTRTCGGGGGAPSPCAPAICSSGGPPAQPPLRRRARRAVLLCRLLPPCRPPGRRTRARRS